MSVETLIADYRDPRHARDLVALLDHYAADPMGGGQPLAGVVRQRLADELAQRPHAFSVLAYSDGEAAGLVNCFEAFSTFAARPLVNIHDLVVHSRFRGQGVAQQLLAAVETEARRRGCCKITLEVLEGNQPAQRTYRHFGFAGYQLDPAMGQALFWQKALHDQPS